jgi:hypothetical protein
MPLITDSNRYSGYFYNELHNGIPKTINIQQVTAKFNVHTQDYPTTNSTIDLTTSPSITAKLYTCEIGYYLAKILSGSAGNIGYFQTLKNACANLLQSRAYLTPNYHITSGEIEGKSKRGRFYPDLTDEEKDLIYAIYLILGSFSDIGVSCWSDVAVNDIVASCLGAVFNDGEPCGARITLPPTIVGDIEIKQTGSLAVTAESTEPINILRAMFDEQYCDIDNKSSYFALCTADMAYQYGGVQRMPMVRNGEDDYGAVTTRCFLPHDFRTIEEEPNANVVRMRLDSNSNMAARAMLMRSMYEMTDGDPISITNQASLTVDQFAQSEDYVAVHWNTGVNRHRDLNPVHLDDFE